MGLFGIDWIFQGLKGGEVTSHGMADGGHIKPVHRDRGEGAGLVDHGHAVSYLHDLIGIVGDHYHPNPTARYDSEEIGDQPPVLGTCPGSGLISDEDAWLPGEGCEEGHHMPLSLV